MCFKGHPTSIPNSCILEFYSNFINIDANKNEFDVYFRKKKKMYYICPDVVATAFMLPRVFEPRYSLNPNSTPTDDAMISHFCGKTMAWDSSNKAGTHYYTCETRAYNLIMCFNLLPLSHRNTISKVRVKFLYAFMTGVSIDLPSVICNSLIEMHQCQDKTSHLIHPSPITRLHTYLKITIPSTIPRVPRSTQPIDKTSISQISNQMN
jgi:hypothetical protein